MSTSKSELGCAINHTFYEWCSEWELTANVTNFAPTWVRWRMNWALPNMALFSMFPLHAICSTRCMLKVRMLWRLYPLLVNFVHFVAAQKQTWHVLHKFNQSLLHIESAPAWWHVAWELGEGMHRRSWLEQPICSRRSLQECQYVRGHQEHGQGRDTCWFAHMVCHGRQNTLLFHAARLSAQTHTLQLTDLLTWKGMVCWSAHCIGWPGGCT